jgi:hypothetical protein
MFIETLFLHIQNYYPMNILKRENRTGDKIMFYYDFGRGAGQRPSAGILNFCEASLRVISDFHETKHLPTHLRKDLFVQNKYSSNSLMKPFPDCDSPLQFLSLVL